MPQRPSPTLRRVLESAARLQEVVPEAVLVGGSAAALHAGHRDSFDHDHVLADLVDRVGQAGTYTVRLRVTDEHGASDVDATTVTVTDSSANTKTVTEVSGSGTIGDASVSLTVKPFLLFGRPLLYLGGGTAHNAGKTYNLFVFAASVPRYGQNGARVTAFAFGPNLSFGQLRIDIDDISVYGLGFDTVSITPTSGNLAWTPITTGPLTSGDYNVRPL